VKHRTRLSVVFLATLLVASAQPPAQAPPQAPAKAVAAVWAQFGGPHRNFVADTTTVAPWTEKGPREVWSRSLGEGYSAISVYDGKLYTMYRQGDQEVVIALDAASGKTQWEFPYAASTEGYGFAEGPGPHATPTVTADRVFTAGATGKLYALDRQTGKPLWSHDLIAEYHATLRDNGYACSPLVFGDTIIMMVGGDTHSVTAFRQSDGSVAWHTPGFENSTSSPVLIELGGEKQVLAFLFKDIAAFDPRSGKLLWSFPHETEYGLNVTLPLFSPEDGLLFLSSAYTGGSRLLKLTPGGGELPAKTQIQELWYSRRLRIHFTNAMRMGDRYFGSSGDLSAGVFTALDLKTGKVAWQDRAVGRAQMLRVGDQMIILDEDGNLILAKPGDSGLQIQSKAQIFTGQSWTAPTLVGSTLYARDRKTIRAFDLHP
jgi:outer membrane protein assembly factor BamB